MNIFLISFIRCLGDLVIKLFPPDEEFSANPDAPGNKRQHSQAGVGSAGVEMIENVF